MKKYMKRIASWFCMLLMVVSMVVPVMAEGNVVNPSPSAGKIVYRGVEVIGAKIDPASYVREGKLFWYIPYKGTLGNGDVENCVITFKKNGGPETVELVLEGSVATKNKFYMGHKDIKDTPLTEGTYEAISAQINFKDGGFARSNASDFTEHTDNTKFEIKSNMASVEGSTPSYTDEVGNPVTASDVTLKVNQMDNNMYNDVVKKSGFALGDDVKTNCFELDLRSISTQFPVKLASGKIKVRVPQYNSNNYTPNKYDVTVYHIVSNADGSQKAVEVPAEWPENAGYIEITADSFSPYVIAYKAKAGTIKPADPVNPGNPANPAEPDDDDDDDDDTSTVVASQNNNTTGSSSNGTAATTTNTTATAPKTGDMAPIAALLFVMICGGAICAVSVKKMITR